MQKRRRALVLTNESARHPFRQSLPPHVFQGFAPEPVRKRRPIDLRDWREFLAAYCASFVAALVFIS